MKIACLVSGGVDSSVALSLLRDAGHDVTAFYLKIWLEDELKHLGDCAWEEDLLFVEETCKKLNVPLTVFSLQQEYWRSVVQETIAEVREGRTPNPDIWCNERIKFGAFYEKIPDEFEKVATGHYAQVEEKNGQFLLKTSADAKKDQTYFLSRLSQRQLSRAWFPIGHLQKQEVRHIAEKKKLPSQNRPDSQGICFLGKFKFSDFLKTHLGEEEGNILERETGNILGKHQGFWFYTHGQRQGIGLSGGPWFVVEKRPKTNEILVSKNATEKSGKNTLFLTSENWIPVCPTAKNYRVKIRHSESFEEGALAFGNNGGAVVHLNKPDRGLSPGQTAVLYDNEYCLGGGIISDCK
ncbi:tRNA 2-thiouridine(34) synthase MnmA [Candidatus Peregrinibacteria bacterium]|nr:MAG: tRNA 2-thiouridine(34) synthase MnmA [Candidatus Peregrinibacteria bacterium]